MADEFTNQYLDWIRDGLAQPGKTQSGLARHLGIAHPQITQLLKGNRNLKVHEIPKIAEYLDRAPPGAEVKQVTPAIIAARVAGIVEAGSFREVDEFDQSEPEQIMLPRDERFPRARLLVFDCNGDSMNDLRPRPIFPGDRLVCISYEDVEGEVELRSGMIVVVQRERDGGHFREWSVKQLELFADRAEFHPRSTNPKHKPIVVRRDHDADDGVTVQVIALVRRVMNEMPGF
ncbi:helix-turn-helix domain-containing protein [Neorhizobium sp. P12A]|uniref:LexA family protein n=1 Tax=Neorhizobium sp. P12A TaxID=2268027 RepID=UPI0011EFC306|nr:XRE family transcriptional regulator [Neorhizobium sp. P12A]KAA0684553.1 helix-turn-helix domain-containing protein [Neorhizobium sp. P12A]